MCGFGECPEGLPPREKAMADAAEKINYLSYVMEGAQMRALQQGFVLALAMVYGEVPQQIEIEIEQCSERGGE